MTDAQIIAASNPSAWGQKVTRSGVYAVADGYDNDGNQMFGSVIDTTTGQCVDQDVMPISWKAY